MEDKKTNEGSNYTEKKETSEYAIVSLVRSNQVLIILASDLYIEFDVYFLLHFLNVSLIFGHYHYKFV